MIPQEINLYRYFKPAKTTASFLSWRRFWLYNGFVVILLTLIYFSSVAEVYYMKSKDKSLQASLIEYQDKFNKMKETYPQLFFSDNINDSVANLKKEVAAQEKIVSILAKRAPFSEDLVSLSKTIIPNVWLTHILIQGNGDDITLTGKSIGIANLHGFIKNLRKDKLFSKYSADIKSIKDHDKDDGKVDLDFEITMVIQ